MYIEEYWKDIDLRLQNLIKFGEVKLPSIKQFKLDFYAHNISKEMGNLTFKELSYSHYKFLEEIGINKYLVPKLFLLARKYFGYNGISNNQYHIARKVSPGNRNEMYRAHFDSHIFTVVFPLKIPATKNEGDTGDLIYFPNLRNNPKNEIQNIIDKIYYKNYASKKGIEKLSKLKIKKIENFKDYQPLIFVEKRHFTLIFLSRHSVQAID